MVSFSKKQNVKIGRVVSKIAGTIIALYAGGVVITELGTAMNGTCSPFYKGLSLIGWDTANVVCSTTSAANANTLNDVSGSGILAVVGIIGLASIVMEFVTIKM